MEENAVKGDVSIIGEASGKVVITGNTCLDKMDHEHVYNILMDNEIGWQAILYELINTEQLDPWNLDIAALTQKYLEKVRELEEANFFMSSSIVLAASLLLRIKSEILLDRYIRSLDEILFGKKEKEKKAIERLEIDESELPLIYPRSPMPRAKKVTLQELVSALSKAIGTENRRIRKEIVLRSARREAEIAFPRVRIRIQDRIRHIYAKIISKFKQRKERIPYSDIAASKEEKIAGFLPVLHLDSQQKIFLEQERHFEEIYVWLYTHYRKEFIDKEELSLKETSERKEEKELLKDIVEEEKKELEELKAEEKISKKTGFDNPLAELFGEI